MITTHKVYADNASTTRIDPVVLNEMMKCYEQYGNPSSLHSMGAKGRYLIKCARQQIAKAINSKEDEIYFTSGGSESNNLAIKGFAEANKDKGRHLITSVVEHPSVLNTMKYLESSGFEVDYISVDKDGVIDVAELESKITSNTIMISIMYANNEIGTLQPIQEIGKIAKENGICFHTDAVQAVGSCNIDVKKFNIDMLTLSGHKFYAPKGVGVLYIKSGVKIENLIHGGHQESGLRAGTENVVSIAGMGKAIELIKKEDSKRVKELRDRLIRGIEKTIPNAKLNGHRTNSATGIVNFSFSGIEGESLLLMLDMNGVYVSAGSACSSGSLDPSHVIRAIGVKDDLAYGTIRFSLGKYNTVEDVDYILSVLPEAIERLRKINNM